MYKEIKLTERQLLTITHLREITGLPTDKEIIAWCIAKIKLPRKRKGKKATTNQKARKCNEVRKRSKSYYRDIIKYLRNI